MNKKLSLSAVIIAVFFLASCGKTLIKDTTPSGSDAGTVLPDSKADQIIYGNSIEDSGITDTTHHAGTFAFTMSGFKGELFIGVADNKFYGTIKFFNWGNGIPQPLTDLKLTEDKIYFKRVISTKEDLLRYGGTSFFEQTFYGVFTADKKKVKGYYHYSGTQDIWEAVKK